MKTVKSSLSRFNSFVNPLGKRQAGGSTPKRIAQSLNHAALKLRAKPIMIDGNLSNRRGFEAVFDAGVERVRTYCKRCGTMAKPNEKECRICHLDFCAFWRANVPLSLDKFDLTCIKCEKYFYAKMTASSKEFKDIFGYRCDVCICFIDEKEKYIADKRRNRLAKKMRTRDEKKVYISQELTAFRVELNSIINMKKDHLTRAEKRELSQRKVWLMRRLDIQK